MTDTPSPSPLPEPEVTLPTTRRVPADYYASPASEVRPLFPRWVRIGCGTAALVILVLLFGGGALVVHAGLGRVMEFVLGSMSKELPTMYAADVTATEKKALENEMSRLRSGLRDEKVPVSRLDKVMSTLRDSIRDQRITRDEAQKLTQVIHEVNTNPAAAAPPRKP